MSHTTMHPRPQCSRRDWLDLCGSWDFAYDDANAGLQGGWPERKDIFTHTIRVPFPPESAASGIGDTTPHPVVWYRRTFEAAAPEGRRRLLLYFGAVDYRAQVWINGQLVACHEGGHTPFSVDITGALRSDQTQQVIVVRAEDQPADRGQPRGKQHWEPEPRGIFYHRTTGIWQPVWLEWVAESYIEELAWTPDVQRGVLGLRVRLNAPPPAPLQLRLRTSLHGQPLIDDCYTIQGVEIYREIALEEARPSLRREHILWSPERPNLIDATLTLLQDNTMLDEVQSYAGMRSAEFAHGRFRLNDRPYYLRMVLEQGYWPQSHLAAPSEDALRREVELIKELGFNGARIHQKVEDPRFLYWCDRLGLLVWGEMANAYLYSREAAERLTREWMEVVRRDYSHPCIVTWVPLNESWGVPGLLHDPAQRAFVQALYSLTRALDPTRPVVGNDGWEHVAGDVLTVHDYAVAGSLLLERYGSPEAVRRTIEQTPPGNYLLALPGYEPDGKAVVISEFGGISYAPKAGERWHGYGTVQDHDEYLAKYEELVSAILACPTIAGFCYTQLTDTEQETNGLLTADRKPKLPIERIRAINQQASRATPIEILARIRAQAARRSMSVSSEQDSPELAGQRA